MNSLTVKYGDVEIDVVDVEGNRWARAKHIAAALEYTRPQAFWKLFNEMKKNGELHEAVHFKYIPLPTPGGDQKTLILSHRGVIRLGMRSNAPKAREFRDWAETVLFDVMVKGYYVSDRVPASSETSVVLETLTETTRLLANLTDRVLQLEATREPYTTVAQRELEERITPYQWWTQIAKKPTWKSANGGGRFDNFCVMEYWVEFRKTPEFRNPPMIRNNKRPEPVWPNNGDTWSFFEKCLRKFKNVPKQQTLFEKRTKARRNKRHLQPM